MFGFSTLTRSKRNRTNKATPCNKKTIVAKKTIATTKTNSDIKRGRWEEWEKQAFLRGLQKHGKGKWKAIAKAIPTRTTIQVKTHAQLVLKKKEAGHDIFADLYEHYSDASTASLVSATPSYSSNEAATTNWMIPVIHVPSRLPVTKTPAANNATKSITPQVPTPFPNMQHARNNTKTPSINNATNWITPVINMPSATPLVKKTAQHDPALNDSDDDDSIEHWISPSKKFHATPWERRLEAAEVLASLHDLILYS